jgi:hypothetical protein
LLRESFPVDDTPNTSRVYNIMDRQAARTLRVIPAVFADTSLDRETEANFKEYNRKKNPDITEEELNVIWQDFCQLVGQQKTQRAERDRRKTMTAEEAAAEWMGKVTERSYTETRLPERTEGESTMTSERISILILAADPTNETHLRLGEEFREIQGQLRSAKQRDRFKLEMPQLSLRPSDISQALLDESPRIVHFSGHGTSTGALCFEDQIGESHLIQPDALAALFEQFADQVDCVILNACHSEAQAIAIAEHVEYVIGMNQAIGDKAAIAFAVGFYQALGAGRTIEEAHKLGCVQIRLHGIPEYLAPVLVTRTQSLQTAPSARASSSAKVNVKRLKLILDLAEEILKQANNSLIENERVLIPLFQNRADPNQVYAEMLQLYHNQQNRGDFGKWKSFLEEARTEETDQEVLDIIADLLSNIDQLHDAFYREDPHFGVKPSKNMTPDKLSVANALRSAGRYDLGRDKILQIADWYLNYLRKIVENIGSSAGSLKAMQ